ncbi:unnamed protein product [Lathyrus oleraceus]
MFAFVVPSFFSLNPLRIGATIGALGALALGVIGPAMIAGLIAAADKTLAKDAPQVANKLGEDFYKVILQEGTFKSTTVVL